MNPFFTPISGVLSKWPSLGREDFPVSPTL